MNIYENHHIDRMANISILSHGYYMFVLIIAYI